jgi:hypothetical protein
LKSTTARQAATPGRGNTATPESSPLRCSRWQQAPEPGNTSLSPLQFITTACRFGPTLHSERRTGNRRMPELSPQRVAVRSSWPRGFAPIAILAALTTLSGCGR